MTISSTTNRVSYAGNGATTVFSFPYYFLLEADLVVIEKNDTTGVETTKTLTTHYTITGEGEAAGGSVTMLVAPASGVSLVIYRDPSPVQSLDLVENDPMPAEEIEESFDKLTMMVQRLKSRLDRSVKLSDGFTDTFDLNLPALMADNPGATLKINDDGDGFDIGPTADEVSDAEANAVAAAASAATASAAAAAALVSETNAAASAAAALVSENNAETAETAAELAETHAETAETAAAASAAAALVAETNAETAETAAELAETNAEAAQTAAELAETHAETAQTAAELAETNAEAAQTAAELAETNAEAAAAAADASADLAAASALEVTELLADVTDGLVFTEPLMHIGVSYEQEITTRTTVRDNLYLAGDITISGTLTVASVTTLNIV